MLCPSYTVHVYVFVCLFCHFDPPLFPINIAFVENGNQILEALGLASKTYMGLMKGLAVLSASNLLVSWLGLHFGGNDFVVAVPPDEVETDDLAPEVDLLYESAKKSHPADAGPSKRLTATPRD
jgi:hypothetical protein